MVVPSKGLETVPVQVAPLRAAAPEPTRFVLVTATLAENVYLQLQQDFPGITPAFGPGELSYVHATVLSQADEPDTAMQSRPENSQLQCHTNELES